LSESNPKFLRAQQPNPAS